MTGDSETGGRAPAAPTDLRCAAGLRGSGPGSTGPGWIVWVTGLSGSGKTTTARLLASRMRAHALGVAVLDGDELRAVLGSDGRSSALEPTGHRSDARRFWAERYARLAGLLADQGLHVVVATISMFEDVRRTNRGSGRPYLEVYLRASEAVRRSRDSRGVYRGPDVVGVDIPWEEPATPDLVLDTERRTAEEVARAVWSALRRRLEVR